MSAISAQDYRPTGVIATSKISRSRNFQSPPSEKIGTGKLNAGTKECLSITKLGNLSSCSILQ